MVVIPIFRGKGGEFRKRLLLKLLDKPKTVQELVDEFAGEYSWGDVKHHLNVLRSNSMLRIFTLYSKVPFHNPVPFDIERSNPRTLYAPSFRSLWESDIFERAYRIHGEDGIRKWFVGMLQGYKISVSPRRTGEIRNIFKLLTDSDFKLLNELRETVSHLTSPKGTNVLFRALYLTDWALIIFFLTFSYMLYTKELQRILKTLGIELDSRATSLMKNLKAIITDPQTKFLDMRLRDVLELQFVGQLLDQVILSLKKQLQLS